MPSVPVACYVDLREYTQADGVLVPVEFDISKKDLPFEPKRLFFIRCVPQGVMRGDHAHRTCKQFFIPIHGTCEVEVRNKNGTQYASLDNPRRGLYVPEMCWVRVTDFDKDTVLLVLASEPYDLKDYIDDPKDFEALL